MTTEDLGLDPTARHVNPSGLNAHATLDSLAADYRAIASAAGTL